MMKAQSEQGRDCVFLSFVSPKTMSSIWWTPTKMTRVLSILVIKLTCWKIREQLTTPEFWEFSFLSRTLKPFISYLGCVENLDIDSGWQSLSWETNSKHILWEFMDGMTRKNILPFLEREIKSYLCSLICKWYHEMSLSSLVMTIN